MKVKVLTVFISVLFLQSCDYFTFKKESRQAVARVNNDYLFKDDLAGIFSKDMSVNDSILVYNNYINNWVKQKLLLAKAQLNMGDKSAEFEKLVTKYREDLYINNYKEAVVNEYLNTVITDYDIEKYYQENSRNFKLNEELLQLKYIKIANNLRNKNQLIKLFKSTKKQDLDSLKASELALQSHHLNDSIWVKYTDLITKIPILKEMDKAALLKKDNFIQKEDSLSLYLVAVKQVLYRNEIAPKSYITPTIKQMILHQRKLILLKSIEETLIDDANKKRQFEIY